MKPQRVRSIRTKREFVPPPGSEETQPTPLDRHFAELMVDLNGAPSSDLEWAAQLVSAWRGAGHICVPLDAIGATGTASRLRATSPVGAPGDFKPLILDARNRLYLHRYWQYEDTLSRAVAERLRSMPEVDATLLSAGLGQFFSAQKNKRGAVDWQREAAKKAVEKNFCVITGGPGTGKTRTVALVLALLAQQSLARAKTLRIALAAPTGKAAARLKESIQRTTEQLDLPEALRNLMPAEAQTLHRLLGVIPDSPYFRHDRCRPLAVDVVIVDEASMVDLALMAKLFDAVPLEARLILVGDKDQLASVEAGYVLGDMCAGASSPGAPISEHIIELKTNYRFGSESAISRLSAAVNAGRVDDALALLQNAVIAPELPMGLATEIKAGPLPVPNSLARHLESRVIAGYRACLESPDPRQALKSLNDFRILCAVRRGPFGVENLNRLTEELLASAGHIDPSTPFYAGRPIVVLRNDYQLKLFNGDMGIFLPDIESGGDLRAFFLNEKGELRRFLPARLPAHETAFAMTVHKSQGSEFGRVLLILPERDSPVITRELLYTGLTRARSQVELWFREPELRLGIGRRTERTSGLRDALSGQARMQ